MHKLLRVDRHLNCLASDIPAFSIIEKGGSRVPSTYHALKEINNFCRATNNFARINSNHWKRFYTKIRIRGLLINFSIFFLLVGDMFGLLQLFTS
jgi:hypothetical protein